MADENQAGPVGIANPKGLEWTEKGLKLNALTATVLRISQGGAIVAPAMEEKPEFDLSSLKQEQGQNNGQGTISNRVVKPEHQDPAPQVRPDSTKPDAPKPDAKVADAEDKPSQSTTDSQATQTSQLAQETQPSSVSQAVQNESVENPSKENIPAPLAKQAELPNTGTKNDNKLLFAGISLLALLGLGFLLKNKKEN